MKIPKIPHWRWLTYHALLDRDHEDITDEILQYARFLEEESGHELEPFDELGLIDVLKHEKSEDEHIGRTLRLREEAPIRKLVEHMMLEHCELDFIQKAVNHKFKELLSVETLEWYKKLFWDTDTLNAYDFGKHYHEIGRDKRPKPPPVADPFRKDYTAYKNGLAVDVDMDDAMKDMFAHSFFRSKELSRLGYGAEEEVLAHQKSARQIYKTVRKESASGGGSQMPDEFDREIVYAEKTASDAEELEGYDPEEDSGHEE